MKSEADKMLEDFMWKQRRKPCDKAAIIIFFLLWFAGLMLGASLAGATGFSGFFALVIWLIMVALAKITAPR